MQVELPIQLRSGAVSSIDAKTRTFELTWTTEHPFAAAGFGAIPTTRNYPSLRKRFAWDG